MRRRDKVYTRFVHNIFGVSHSPYYPPSHASIKSLRLYLLKNAIIVCKSIHVHHNSTSSKEEHTLCISDLNVKRVLPEMGHPTVQ